jgi:hypothetical protein
LSLVVLCELSLLSIRGFKRLSQCFTGFHDEPPGCDTLPKMICIGM